jgi:hypothetical protein
MTDPFPMPGDRIEVNGETFVVLDVASLDGRILVDGPRGQEWIALPE